MGGQREFWGDIYSSRVSNYCLGLTCSIADAVIFVFNVRNYFRNEGGWMRGNIEFFQIDLRKEPFIFFSQLLKVSINKKII